MKKSNKTIRIVLCSIFMIAFFSSRVWAIALSFEEPASTINIDESIEIDLVISGLEDNNLAAFDFDVNFDGTILNLDTYTLGTVLNGWEMSGGISGEGTFSCFINLIEVGPPWNDYTSQPDSFTLATLTFTGVSEGTSLLSFSNVLLSDDDWPAEALSPVTLNTGSVDVVPEPGTLLLFAIGLCGYGLVARGSMKN